jgi:RNA polymerase primary sigma factor
MTAEVYPQPNEENEAFVIAYKESNSEEIATHITFSEDPVKAYLRNIGKTPLLNAEEEVDLSKRIEAGLFAASILIGESDSNNVTAKPEELSWIKADGEQAKEHLIEANLRLVVSLAKRYTSRSNSLEFLDLIQEGTKGLIRAAEKFDYTMGYKFSTYATWWIEQSLTRGLAEYSRTIRVPVHRVEEINKYNRTRRQLTNELGREPTTTEVADEIGVPSKKIDDLEKIIRQEPVSLSLPIGETGGRGHTDRELGDSQEDKTALSVDEQVESTMLKLEIEKALDLFAEKEVEIIKMRFGLDGSKPASLSEIGKIYDLSSEGVRQIEQRVLRRLRKPDVTDRLKDFR